jgi:hypothetical protein
MEPARHDFACRKGDGFVAELTWVDEDGTPIDLAGYTAKMEIRDGYEGQPVVALLQGAGITLAGAGGTIRIAIADDVTAAIPVPTDPRVYPAVKSYLYDLVLTPPGGEAFALLEGRFDVRAGVTR